MRKIYIGIDPDLRLLNASIVTDDLKLLAVFARRNKEGMDNVAVENSVSAALQLCNDVRFFISTSQTEPVRTVLCIESQNMERARQDRARGKKIKPEDIRRLAQVTGSVMGVFRSYIGEIKLLQPIIWKKTMKDHIVQSRAYSTLSLTSYPMGGKKPYHVPCDVTRARITLFSHDKINPGDFSDISDSIAIAVYGAKNNL